jgi:predicted RNA-binding Zn-ribbon protein involved in translation (DUF1610 family)
MTLVSPSHLAQLGIDSAIASGIALFFATTMAIYAIKGLRSEHPSVLPGLAAVALGVLSAFCTPELLLFDVAPISIGGYSIWRAPREYRVKNNLCLKCGYSLEGLAERRCPECGQRILRAD